MIEVHVTNALLAPYFRQGALFRALDFINGLVAPAFLFCAGYAAASGRHRFSRDVRRSAVLLIGGYALHASALLRGDWAGFFQADVLQIVALSLLALSATARLAGSHRTLAWVTVAGLLLLLAPLARAMNTSGWPAALRPYWTDAVPSQFPLLPWAGFVFAGAAAATASPARLAVLGAAVVGIGLMCGLIWPTPTLPEAYRAWPLVAFTRLGLVMLIAGVLARAEAVSLGGADTLLNLLSKRSLFVYFTHIALVYGTHPASLRSLIGATLGPAACALIWAGVTASMALASAKAPRVTLY